MRGNRKKDITSKRLVSAGQSVIGYGKDTKKYIDYNKNQNNNNINDIKEINDIGTVNTNIMEAVKEPKETLNEQITTLRTALAEAIQQLDRSSTNLLNKSNKSSNEKENEEENKNIEEAIELINKNKDNAIKNYTSKERDENTEIVNKINELREDIESTIIHIDENNLNKDNKTISDNEKKLIDKIIKLKPYISKETAEQIIKLKEDIEDTLKLQQYPSSASKGTNTKHEKEQQKDNNNITQYREPKQNTDPKKGQSGKIYRIKENEIKKNLAKIIMNEATEKTDEEKKYIEDNKNKDYNDNIDLNTTDIKNIMKSIKAQKKDNDMKYKTTDNFRKKQTDKNNDISMLAKHDSEEKNEKSPLPSDLKRENNFNYGKKNINNIHTIKDINKIDKKDKIKNDEEKIKKDNKKQNDKQSINKGLQNNDQLISNKNGQHANRLSNSVPVNEQSNNNGQNTFQDKLDKVADMEKRLGLRNKIINPRALSANIKKFVPNGMFLWSGNSYGMHSIVEMDPKGQINASKLIKKDNSLKKSTNSITLISRDAKEEKIPIFYEYFGAHNEGIHSYYLSKDIKKSIQEQQQKRPKSAKLKQKIKIEEDDVVNNQNEEQQNNQQIKNDVVNNQLKIDNNESNNNNQLNEDKKEKESDKNSNTNLPMELQDSNNEDIKILNNNNHLDEDKKETEINKNSNTNLPMELHNNNSNKKRKIYEMMNELENRNEKLREIISKYPESDLKSNNSEEKSI